MNKIKIIIVIVLIVCICLLNFVQKGNNSSGVTLAEPNTELTKEKIKKYENIVFLGDSITEYYPIEEIYGDLPIVKSGTAGFRTKDIISRMDSMVYRYNPTSVYLLIGTNDLINDKEEDTLEAISNIKEIIENLKKERKRSTTYVQSIYPINAKLDPTRNKVGFRSNETIKRVNKEIKDYCEETGNCTFINLYDELVDEDGNLSKEYTEDGLHPNDLGYAKITRVLMEYICSIN